MSVMRLAGAFAVLLLSSACSTCPRETATPGIDSVCFRHAGPPDKPMPDFCVVRPATRKNCHEVLSVPAGFTRSFVSANAWNELLRIVRLPRTESPPTAEEFGQYRATIHPDAATRHLDRETMRSVAAVIADDARAAQRPAPAEVSLLLRRLPR